MNYRRIIIALLALAALFAAGCRSSRHAQRSAEPQPAQQPAAAAPEPEPARTYTLVNFTGQAEGTTFNGQLRMASDSIIWMNVSKFIELGRAIATPDSVQAYAPIFGKRFAGTYADVQRSAKVKTSFSDLQDIAQSDRMEELIRRLAAQMGFDVTVRVTRREQPSSLSFPFHMPQ